VIETFELREIPRGEASRGEQHARQER